MRKNAFARATLAAAGAALGAAAHAVQPEDAGLYVGAEIGKSSVSSHVYQESNDPVVGATFGVVVNPNVSFEIFARSLSFRIFDALAGDTTYYPSGHVGVAVLGVLPLNEKFQFYGRFGMGRTTLHADSASLANAVPSVPARPPEGH